jgi:hypothetical protein
MELTLSGGDEAEVQVVQGIHGFCFGEAVVWGAGAAVVLRVHEVHLAWHGRKQLGSFWDSTNKVILAMVRTPSGGGHL